MAHAHAGRRARDHEISPISPTVDYGTPAGAGPSSPTPPHEMPWTMVVPSLVLALLAAVIGFINLPFTNFEFLTDWLDPVFRGVTEPGPELVRAGRDARRRLGDDRVHRHLLRLDGLPPRPRRSRGRPARPAARARSAACSATPTTSTRRSRGWSTARCAPRALAGHDGFDLGIIDGAVNGIAELVRGAALGLRQAQTGLVRQYALGIVLGVVLLLLYALARAGF